MINVQEIMATMVEQKLSIREVASKYNIPKSTLHARLQNFARINCELPLVKKYNDLLNTNILNMHSKGGKNSYKNRKHK